MKTAAATAAAVLAIAAAAPIPVLAAKATEWTRRSRPPSHVSATSPKTRSMS